MEARTKAVSFRPEVEQRPSCNWPSGPADSPSAGEGFCGLAADGARDDRCSGAAGVWRHFCLSDWSAGERGWFLAVGGWRPLDRAPNWSCPSSGQSLGAAVGGRGEPFRLSPIFSVQRLGRLFGQEPLFGQLSELTGWTVLDETRATALLHCCIVALLHRCIAASATRVRNFSKIHPNG